MFGLLNIDKPTGPTSRDVVNRVARLVKPHKAGHAGTLDPLATGVLIVAIGPATRLVEYVQRLPKTYIGTFLLGQTSDTEDSEGEVHFLPASRIPSLVEISQALPQFIGIISQRPPAYSALKVKGRRAYDLSRRGQTVELAARPVMIHRLELLRYAYPELQLKIECGSGTYIRSLGRDIAVALGTQAVMSALERTEIGPFSVSEAIPYDDLNEERIRQRLMPPQLGLGAIARLVVGDDEAKRLMQGQPIQQQAPTGDVEAAAIDSQGQLIAILEHRDNQWWPAKCFAR